MKRILTIACGVALGIGIASGAARLAFAWGIFPNRDLNQATSYVREVMTIVGENYVESKKASIGDMTKSALHGIVENLDPHSEFLEAKYFTELEEDLGTEFGGIGVQVELRKGRIYVISPMQGSPGDRAGIRRGDEITSIDGAPLDKPSMDNVVEKLRGKPQTQVAIGIFRPSEKRDFVVTLMREMIKTESVRNVHLLPGGIGYIQITQFTERTGEEFFDALNALAKQNANSLIIDLRNNPGGVLEAAVTVADPFFKKGELIVYTQGRTAKDRDEYRAESDDQPITVPMAVLINASSASASEVLAGALKDTNRAVIVGERSFGKGSVQSIFKLKNGEGMKLTTARYYTPSGITIHEHGVEPQVEVVLTPDEDENVGMQLSRPELAADPVAFRERFDKNPLPDRQLQAAIAVLQGVDALSRWEPDVTDSKDAAKAASGTAAPAQKSK